MKNALTKLAPSLKVVADTEAADKLRELLKDADDGFRRVVKVGLYIEWIAANLPHGQFMGWLEAHAPDVSQRSIYNWRSLAKNLCEWADLKFASLANLTIAGDKLLDLPVKELPLQLQKCRLIMDEALAESKSARQLFLFLGFNQAEIDPKTGYPMRKRGQLKGSKGLTKEMREKAAARTEEQRINELEESIIESNVWELEIADAKNLGAMDSKLLEKFIQARETSIGFARRTLEARKGQRTEEV